MAEPRKNHLTIDGAHVNEVDHITSSYKAIPEAETEFRTSKASLAKSKERLSADGAEEKLLEKETEAKITTRVDMADAKYVVGDHRNGDAKIELDANKKFSGLTKEELMKYADDPFWVRLRCFMFILFWALWVAMLVAAVAIIVMAPKCPPPEPRPAYERNVIVDMSAMNEIPLLETKLQALKEAEVQAIFVSGELAGDTYSVLEDQTALNAVQAFITKAKEYGVRVIVDLTANYVPRTHKWFVASEANSSHSGYFTWADGNGFDDKGNPNPPNNWTSTLDQPAWTWSPARKQFYLHQYSADQPDLNFRNEAVVAEFDGVLKKWVGVGVAGVRLLKARQLLVDPALKDELPRSGSKVDLTAVHTDYKFQQTKQKSDQPALADLLRHWSRVVNTTGGTDSVFTLKEEDNDRAEYRLSKGELRPPGALPVDASNPDAGAVVKQLTAKFNYWPALQLTGSPADQEIATFAMLLPATPIITFDQIGNKTSLTKLRSNNAIQYGQNIIASAPSKGSSPNSTFSLLVCARPYGTATSYAAVYNPADEDLRGDLSTVASIPDKALVFYVSNATKAIANYTMGAELKTAELLVPAKRTVVLSYSPVANK